MVNRYSWPVFFGRLYPRNSTPPPASVQPRNQGCADGVTRLGDAPHPQASGQQERGGGEEESAHGVQVGLDFSILVRPLMLSQAGSMKQRLLEVDDVKRRDRARPCPPLFVIEQRRIAHPPAAPVSSSRVDDNISVSSFYYVHRVIHPSLIQTHL